MKSGILIDDCKNLDRWSSDWADDAIGSSATNTSDSDAELQQREAAMHMAVDQSLAEWANEHRQAVFRWYRWRRPALTLGYFQSFSQRSEFDSLANCPTVRRSTGGGAILHDQELTYSIALPADGSKGHVEELYEEVHRAVIAQLKLAGWDAEFARDQKARGNACYCDPKSFLCFDRRADNDVVIGESKILGSAQRRFGNAILQHGSLLLNSSQLTPHLHGFLDVKRQPTEGGHGPSDLPEADSGHLESVRTAVVESIAKLTGIVFNEFENESRKVERAIRSSAQRIARFRFQSEEWTKKRL